MKPLVSIIIPTYNRAHLISETLNSVLAQTYINWECIIVDDGSTDNTEEVIKKYLNSDSRFVYLSRPVNKKKGPSSCRNFGIAKSYGEYIVFLDSDDLFVSTCIENRIAFAFQNPEFDFWIFKMETFGDNKNPICEYGFHLYSNENEYCKNQFLEGNHPFVITCPLWKKYVLLEINGFNEVLLRYEDPDLHLRALKRGYRLKFANFEKADCFYRIDEFKIIILENFKLNNKYIFMEIHLNNHDISSILHFKKIVNGLIFKKVLVFHFFKFCKLAINKNIFFYKNVFFGVILLIYNSIGLNKFKYIGYNFFKKKFNNF